MKNLFKKFKGVLSVKSGYCGGSTKNPTYEKVKTGETNHVETVEIIFDKNITSYEKILKYFFTIHDPTSINRQQNDIGSQYRSNIFYVDEEQKESAIKIIDKANNSNLLDGAIVTKVDKFEIFYPAKDHHQAYLDKNPDGYNCHFVRNNWEF